MASAVHSHLESLCHTATAPPPTPRVYPERMVYNGTPLRIAATASGCKVGIDNVAAQGIFTRGILFDATLLPQLREGSSAWLAPGTRVTRAHIEALERLARVTAGPGDVILLHAGRWARRGAEGPWATPV